jgi:DNA-directed RNA polymerase alpha subunit
MRTSRRSPRAASSTWNAAWRGRGYVSADKNFDEDRIGWIPIDSVHSPIKKVNYLAERRASDRRPTTPS